MESPSLDAGLQKKPERRVVETAGTKAAIADGLVKLGEIAATPAEFKRQAVRTYKKPWKQLQRILQDREELRKRAKELQFGAHVDKRRQGVNQFVKRSSLKQNRGCRRPGGGRKDSFAAWKHKVKAWLERERLMQHAVDSSDLLEAFFDDVVEEVELLEKKERRGVAEEEAGVRAGRDEHAGI